MIAAIVPAYNEEQKISSVVRDLLNVVEVVVVINDGSTDNTGEKAKEAGASYVLNHLINRGQGAALETGNEFCKKIGVEYVVHFDGDGQFSAEEIPIALQKIQETGADVLLGSRFLGVKSEIPWFKRMVVLPIACFVNRIFYKINFTDAHNGFRVLNRIALEKIVISQDRMAHATEIPVLAKKYNLKIIEHPVKVSYKRYGQSFFSGFNVLGDLILAKFIK